MPNWPWSRKTNENPKSISSSAPIIEDLIDQFLSIRGYGESLADLRRFIERHKTGLLTGDAITELQKRLNYRLAHPNEQGLPAAGLLHRLNLLQKARTQGISKAWEQFYVHENRFNEKFMAAQMRSGLAASLEAEPKPIIMVQTLVPNVATDKATTLFEILDTLVNPILPDVAYEVLHSWDDLLYSPEMFALIDSNIVILRIGGDLDAANRLEFYKTILQDVKMEGAGVAWKRLVEQQEEIWQTARDVAFEATQARFMQNPNILQELDNVDPVGEEKKRQAKDALLELLSTSNWDETRHVLEQRQSYLLTDVTIKLLEEAITDARLAFDEDKVNFFLMHLHLIKDARIRGIPTAWQTFERSLHYLKSENSE
ncbi:MAG TPA: hypothetical protein VNG51_15800 [Ktedonobacteraceae bacterium]|nr:hypothetical protein [Ktedonobacteraceae bacterium]